MFWDKPKNDDILGSVNDPMHICDTWFRVYKTGWTNYFAVLSRKVWVIACVFMFSVRSSAIMLILTLIKDTAIFPAHVCVMPCVCLHLPVCLTDSRTASCFLRTFCSLPPRLSGVSTYLNCAAPLYWIAATLAHAFSVEYCHQSSVAAEALEMAVNLCVFACVCSCEPMKWQVWAMCARVWNCFLTRMQEGVFFGNQMGRSIQVSPARREE